jgi:hypothetical protein
MRPLFALLCLTAVARAGAPAVCAAERDRATALRNVLASVGETTAEYRAMMLKKIQAAEAAVAACERATADQKHSEEARLATKRREEEAAAKKEATERFAIDGLKSEASFLRLAWSAYACSIEKERDALLANPFASAEQKEDLKRSETSLARIHSVMKRGKLQPLSCHAEDVAKLAFCIGDGKSHSACAQPELARMIVAEREVIAAVQLTPSEPPLTPAQQKEKLEEDDSTLLRPEF